MSFGDTTWTSRAANAYLFALPRSEALRCASGRVLKSLPLEGACWRWRKANGGQGVSARDYRLQRREQRRRSCGLGVRRRRSAKQGTQKAVTKKGEAPLQELPNATGSTPNLTVHAAVIMQHRTKARRRVSAPRSAFVAIAGRRACTLRLKEGQ